jgi:hypothetical protein
MQLAVIDFARNVLGWKGIAIRSILSYNVHMMQELVSLALKGFLQFSSQL